MTRSETTEKTLDASGFYGRVCFCLCVTDQAIPLLWPLKPTMGVLCLHIKRGRKGGSRIMLCGAAAQRARMSTTEGGCVCGGGTHIRSWLLLGTLHRLTLIS